MPEGKDTANVEARPCVTYLPSSVERNLRQFHTAENIAPRDQFVELTERGVRAALKLNAEAAAELTGDRDYRPVNSYNLRRPFAQGVLIEEELNPRVVMQLGGWNSFQAIEPYPNASTPDVVNDAFEEAGLM